MKIECVYFDSEWFALISQQDDWTGNYKYYMRKVNDKDDTIRFAGQNINVSAEIEKAHNKRDELEALRKQNRELMKHF